MTDLSLPTRTGTVTVYADGQGDVIRVERRADGSLYGQADSYDAAWATDAEAAAYLAKYGYRVIGWE